ncbi:PH domain-containing protein [Mariniluteicoccus endophyticus]
MVKASGIAPDERVVHHLRTHPKAFYVPLLSVLALCVIGIAVGVLLPAEYATVGWIVIGVVCAAALLWFLVGPFMRWRSRTYTITDRRIITRAGVLNRTGHDIQLRKVNAVSYEKSVTDRLFGCGTLKLDTASEAGVVVLPDIPGVEQVHLDINELLHDSESDPREGRISE